jgi:MoaD family protein
VAVDVRIPTVLRAHTGGQASVSAEGASIGELFEALAARYPDLRAHLLTDAGELHRFVNVYVNDEDVRYLDQLDTKLADGDEVTILPAVAGGAVDRSE